MAAVPKTNTAMAPVPDPLQPRLQASAETRRNKPRAPIMANMISPACPDSSLSPVIFALMYMPSCFLNSFFSILFSE